ncbi:endonuclease/exonuclease/phosphatase family protein [Phytoactinopolyspora mesophila]|nr:endonuclease/exonuclease/phosphatase family protein [Phytoactinopolyspora mesophila]
MSVRVMTTNVLSPEHADWDSRQPVLQSTLAELRPDVIALQEVVTADFLDSGYALAWHGRRSADGVGAALASRWPLGTVAETDLQVNNRTEDFPWAGVVVAEILAPEPFLFVHNKPSWPIPQTYEREQQALRCARFIEEQRAGRRIHVVLAGDFDATPDSSSIRFWTGRQSLGGMSVAYQDAWEALHPDDPGHTFSPRNPLVREGEMFLETGRRIDYIMVRCGSHGPTLEVADCFLAFDQPVDGVWATDHFGVVADLRMPARPPSSW